MRGVDGNETCPSCYLVLIDLADFDARDDMSSVDSGRLIYNRYEMFDEGGTRLSEVIGAYFKQWRLNRVLRRYPRSLYCPYCGYIERRR
jgi:hypothetical protein